MRRISHFFHVTLVTFLKKEPLPAFQRANFSAKIAFVMGHVIILIDISGPAI
jgi:hypothetical protein